MLAIVERLGYADRGPSPSEESALPDNPATIRDVARAAQLSVASVSRVLNGQSSVNPVTRDRVLAAVRMLGYVPNAAARSLSMARAHAIGVVLPDLHGEFYGEMVRGMDAAASARGYLLLLANMHADRRLAGQAMAAMRGRVDGLIVMAPQLAADDLALALPVALKTVLVNSPPSEAHHGIRIDNAAGVVVMVEHLLAVGCRRIVHLAGMAGNLDATERCEAFRAAMTARAPDLPVRILTGDFTETSGERLIGELIDKGEPFDAVFAANDMTALGALQALRVAGRADDVAVAGFDDVPLARFLNLTTLRADMAGIGTRAVNRLIDLLEGGAEGLHLERVVPELVVRGSTARHGR